MATIRRAAWGIGDQALSSLTNFGLAIGVAGQVGTQAFGAFSIAFAIYLVALTVMRALAADPLVIRYSGRPIAEQREAIRASTGTALVVGVVAGLAILVAGWWIRGTLGESLMVMGAGLPALLVQDAWRYAFFATGRGRSAFVNDLAWTVVLVVAFIVVIATGHRSIPAFTLAWVCGAAAGALLGIRQSGVVPAPTRVLAWWREHLGIAPRLAVEGAILSGAQPVTLSLVGSVAGLVTVGTIRAGQVLTNALHILTYGIQLFGVPEGVRMLQRSPAALRNMCLAFGLALMGISVAWGLVLLALPTGIGHALLGVSWDPARTVILPATVLAAASGMQSGALIGLRALAATRRSLSARILTSGMIAVGAVAGAVFGGAIGGAWGYALGLGVGSAFWWGQFLRALHDHARTASSDVVQAPSAVELAEDAAVTG